MNTWWSDRDIEIVEIENRYFALNGWNGEIYTDCWETEKPEYGTAHEIIKDSHIAIIPIYEKIEGSDQMEITGYEILWE